MYSRRQNRSLNAKGTLDAGKDVETLRSEIENEQRMTYVHFALIIGDELVFMILIFSVNYSFIMSNYVIPYLLYLFLHFL